MRLHCSADFVVRAARFVRPIIGRRPGRGADSQRPRYISRYGPAASLQSWQKAGSVSVWRKASKSRCGPAVSGMPGRPPGRRKTGPSVGNSTTP